MLKWHLRPFKSSWASDVVLVRKKDGKFNLQLTFNNLALHQREIATHMNYYREYIPHMAEIAAPLYSLTKKGVRWMWTDDYENAFRW